MYNNFFNIQSKVQNVEIPLNEVDASFDGYHSYLHFLANFNLRPCDERSEFDVLTITARLILNKGEKISRVVIHPNISVNAECIYSYWIKFELNNGALEFIESKRVGDIEFKIEFDFQILLRSLGGIDKKTKNADGLVVASTFLQPNIPKSIWAEKLLKCMGYKSFTLVEIPLHHSLLEDVYDEILQEFQQAEQYFLKQDYNKTIAHCRSTMDALTRNLKKIKQNEPSETKFKWLENVSTTTFSFIDGLNKSTAAIASKTHHAVSSNKNFNRIDAESIYLVTLGLLHFINGVRNQSS